MVLRRSMWQKIFILLTHLFHYLFCFSHLKADAETEFMENHLCHCSHSDEQDELNETSKEVD